MTAVEQLWVDGSNARIAVVCWGARETAKPPVLLSHGTSFTAEIWEEVAEALVADHTVYALDRRGHGKSDKPPPERYHFMDFALDLRAVIEALKLTGIVGVGHSAGATDLLIAAKLLPRHFARIFAMEPTMMDVRAKRPDAQLSEERRTVMERARRRRAEFESAAAALERFRAAPAFAHWTDRALRAYVHHGFETLAQGGVRLRCSPQIEAAMLGPIFETMEQIYDGDERGNPFDGLSDLGCPVRVSTAERSAPIYKEMAERSLRVIPHATRWSFEGVGHSVAQEKPAVVLEALEVFAHDTGVDPRPV
jgi:pimeloyl-ACP methyl ester carboxylesterase